MANTQSAKKRIRQNIKRQARNKSIRSATKTQARKFLGAVHDKNIEKAEQEFKLLAKKLDQVAARHTIHKNKASRGKARMQRRLNELKNAAT